MVVLGAAACDGDIFLVTVPVVVAVVVDGGCECAVVVGTVVIETGGGCVVVVVGIVPLE